MGRHAPCSGPKVFPCAEIRRANLPGSSPRISRPAGGPVPGGGFMITKSLHGYGMRSLPWDETEPGPVLPAVLCRRHPADPPLPESHLCLLSAPQAVLGGNERGLGALHACLGSGSHRLAARPGLG